MKKRSKQLAALLLLMYYTAMEALAANHHFLQRYLPEKRWRWQEHRNFHDTKATRFGRGFHPKTGPNSISTGSRTNKTQPYVFRSPNNTVVTAQTDTTVILHCEVNDIVDPKEWGNVSWIRKGKKGNPPQILTVGNKTHISDHRFYASNEKYQKDWTLHLRYATLRDDGDYECQIPTHPTFSLFVHLHLVEAEAQILGLSRKVVKAGSPLRLSCRLNHSIEAPTYIFWYHENRMINYDLQGGAGVRHGRQGSELIIPRAEPRHAGNYSCVPSNARQASVTVEVRLKNEKQAAMQHSNKNGGLQKSKSFNLMCILIWTIFLQR